MLNRLHVQGYKALRDVTVDFGRLTVFVGRNGVGKSSILESIECLGATADSASRQAALGRLEDGAEALLTRGAFQMELLALLGEKKLCVNLKRRRNRGWQARVTSDGKRLEGSDGGPTHLMSVSVLRHQVQELRAPSPVGIEVPRLKPSGAGLATVINYIAGQRDASIERIEEGLSRIVPAARRVRTQPVALPAPLGASVGQLPGTTLEVEFQGIGWVPASEVSEGTLLALGLLTVIHGPVPSSLLLVDDLERGLHPAAQQRLVGLLRTLMESERDLQVIATTHSPDLLDACEPHEVRVLGGPDGNAHVEPLKNHDKSDLLQVLRTGEFWSSVGEDWVRG